MRKFLPLIYFLFLYLVFLVLSPVYLDLGGIVLSKRLAALLIFWLALLPNVLMSKRYMEPAWHGTLYEIFPRFLRGRISTIVFMSLSFASFLFLFLAGIFNVKNLQDIVSVFLIYLCACPLFARLFQAAEGPFRGRFGQWLYDHKSEILKRGKANFRGNSITAETKVVRYKAVLSYLFVTKPFESPLILVGQERFHSFLALVSYSFLTFVFGWWNIPQGIIQTFRAILSNSRGGQTKTVGAILGRLSDQAVLVHLKLSSGKFGEDEERERIEELSNRLNDLVQKADVGELDGDEYGNGECVLFFYGGNADKLYSAMEPTLLLSPLSKGGFAVKQYGENSRSKKAKINL